MEALEESSGKAASGRPTRHPFSGFQLTYLTYPALVSRDTRISVRTVHLPGRRSGSALTNGSWFSDTPGVACNLLSNNEFDEATIPGTCAPWYAHRSTSKECHTMATGTIKSILYDKGFGFIAPDNNTGQGGDLFFHQSSVSDGGFDQMREGQRVEFDDEPDPRNASRRRAGNVSLASE